MKVLGDLELLQALSRSLGKPVIYVKIPEPPEDFLEYQDFVKELEKSAPFLFEKDVDVVDFITRGHGYVVCDDLAELNKVFDGTVGPDGPTETNSYDGPVRVYLLTSTGNENT